MIRTAVALLATATAATAAGAAPRTEPTVVAAGASTAAAPASPVVSADQRYCFRTEATGTRILQKVCRTQQQWLAEGVDAAALARR